MKKIMLAFAVLFSVVLGTPALAVAQSSTSGAKDAVCQGVGLTGSGCDDKSSTSVGDMLKMVINVLSFIVGFVAVIMIIIGGLKYITSGGDSSSTNSAKNTILYAVIGLAVVALAQIIVRFVVSKF